VLAGDRVDRLGQGVLGVHRRSVLPPGQALDRIYPDRSRAAGAERRRIASCGGGPPALSRSRLGRCRRWHHRRHRFRLTQSKTRPAGQSRSSSAPAQQSYGRRRE
jgi:hypothetical protein